MIRNLRQQALDRAFGRGAGGFVAATAIGWFIDQVRSSNQPERLDTARLVPGETYLVTTRPAMNRKERRDSKKLRRRTAKLDQVRRPGRATRRTARKLGAAQRKVGKAKPGTRRAARRERRAAELGTRFDTLTAPSREQRKLEAEVARLSGRLEEHRRRALAASASKRKPRTRTFT